MGVPNFICLFVRKKPNKSGTVSVQIIDKSRGKYHVVKTVGSSSDPQYVEQLVNKANDLIPGISGKPQLPFPSDQESHFISFLKDNIISHKLIGPSVVLGKLFSEIGFNKIEDEMFRHLVICRLIYPRSKLRTVEYLRRYMNFDSDTDKVYRYLDKLHNKYKEKIQRISYEHTLKILGGEIAVVFYDVTTIYFEAEQEDELRITGFSKDGKHQHPQIMLGLLVSAGGYPLAYEIFEGNSFEGHTMVPVLESFRNTYKIDNLIVIADAGLLSQKNIEALTSQGFSYILGARLKNMSEEITEKILSLTLSDGQHTTILQQENRLVISHSSKREKKDAHNRQRGLQRLEKALAKGKLTKQHINNRGYNKYLTIAGQVDVAINYEKFHQDARWDGLKGYLTNTSLNADQVIKNYNQLWLIEKAFRISKTDLRIRPIYHRLSHRIEAHIAISFCAYKIYKELERQLSEKKIRLGVSKAIDILNSIFAITIQLPNSQQIATIPIITTEEQREILAIFGQENFKMKKI